MTTYPVIVAGMDPTSALFQSMLPVVSYKSSDQSVTSSTTLVNDTALVLPLAANAKYWFDLVVSYVGGTLGSSDIKFAWSVPSGTTMAYQWLIQNTGGGSQTGQGGGGTTLVCGTAGATFQAASMRGSIITSGTSGNLQLEWAQNTSNATATTVKAGSIFIARRVG